MGTLYVVATPIGNLDDITLRAVKVLNEVSIIASEDTRHTGVMLKRLGIATPQMSYHAFNEKSRLAGILSHLQSGDVALVTDAGTPSVSDPGVILVKAVAEAGHSVIPIPGASAVTAAVSVSGLVTGPFTFLGFLPRTTSQRLKILESALSSGFSLVFFESPHRLKATARELAQLCSSREIVIFRELTKVYEEAIRGTISNILDHLDQRVMKGECVVVLGPSQVEPASDHLLEDLLRNQLASGSGIAETARKVAAITGIPKSTVYRAALAIASEKS